MATVPPPLEARELRGDLREPLEELVHRLRSEHDEYERAAQSWTEEAAEKKRDARKAREGTLHEIEQLLAREAEADRLAHLGRLPFARKVAELESWVEHRPAARESMPVSEIISVAAVVAAHAAPERSPPPKPTPVLRPAPPVRTVTLPLPRRSPLAEPAVVKPPPQAPTPANHPANLPAKQGRRRLTTRMKERSLAVGVALFALVLAVLAWRAAHRGGTQAGNELPAAADRAPRAVAPVTAAELPPCASRAFEACAPSAAEPPAHPSSPKRTASPPPRPPQPKTRLTWPSAKGGSL